ncbi:hypothetical protein BC834DRAFT_270827 [Gloeopeniophorella convolvens]|nr:hypothetical protein BC834DRAFT_270827 [Gloeopeniophorella convolvens]
MSPAQRKFMKIRGENDDIWVRIAEKLDGRRSRGTPSQFGVRLEVGGVHRSFGNFGRHDARQGLNTGVGCPIPGETMSWGREPSVSKPSRKRWVVASGCRVKLAGGGNLTKTDQNGGVSPQRPSGVRRSAPGRLATVPPAALRPQPHASNPCATHRLLLSCIFQVTFRDLHSFPG